MVQITSEAVTESPFLYSWIIIISIIINDINYHLFIIVYNKMKLKFKQL